VAVGVRAGVLGDAPRTLPSAAGGLLAEAAEAESRAVQFPHLVAWRLVQVWMAGAAQAVDPRLVGGVMAVVKPELRKVSWWRWIKWWFGR
jgi:hypothetical protein